MEDTSLPILLRRLVSERFPNGDVANGPNLTIAATRLSGSLTEVPKWSVSVSSLSKWTRPGATLPSYVGLCNLLDALSAVRHVAAKDRTAALSALRDARVAP